MPLHHYITLSWLCICLCAGPQSLKGYRENTSIEGAPTSESEDDKKVHTPEKTKSSNSITSAPSTLSASASDDNRWKSELARRRAERDSWRKRHEEEKERLRIRIEKNRQDIQRQLQEKEAEFNRMQEELEREQRSLKELQQEKLAAGDYNGADVPMSYKCYMEEFGSSPTWDHVLYNHRKQQIHGATARNTSSPVEDVRVSVSNANVLHSCLMGVCISKVFNSQLDTGHLHNCLNFQLCVNTCTLHIWDTSLLLSFVFLSHFIH